MEFTSFAGMPSFRDPEGSVWVWDAESHTYVVKPEHDQVPDRGHATGGDNNLFDPFVHTEYEDVPELEGHMAAFTPPGTVLCPNCANASAHRACEICGKDLTPEWNTQDDKDSQQFQ